LLYLKVVQSVVPKMVGVTQKQGDALVYPDTMAKIAKVSAGKIYSSGLFLTDDE
jgi:hypothetical protein